jgi:hypothetical protein
LPPGGPPGIGGNPIVKDLSDDQKDMLKAIQEKYGTMGKSPLAYIIEEGDHTQDVDLQ